MPINTKRPSTVLHLTNAIIQLLDDWVETFGQGVLVRFGGQDVALESVLSGDVSKVYIRRTTLTQITRDIVANCFC